MNLELRTLMQLIDEGLRANLPKFWAVAIECLSVGLALLAGYAVLAMLLIYVERKVCAWFQVRIGPNRVGPFGIFQTVADTLKMLLKEVIPINHVDRFLFYTAPFVVIAASMLTFAALPFAKGIQAIDFNIGVFYIMAISSISILGILLAGWSSNNKFSMIGAMRSGAQMISYELSVGLSLLAIVMLSGTMQLSTLVEQQADLWFIFQGHVPAFIAFVIYLIAGHAETNRGPFDLPEAESELTAGFHTEYSGIHFGFFYLAEYLNMFIIAGIAATVFLGGWQPLHIPGLDGFNYVMDFIPSFIWFLAKVFFLIFLSLWVRWTFPRLRIDQLLHLEWKYLMPLSLLNILIMAVLVVMGWHF
ncbi:MAG: NADH-quinone oxidoreductase subunit NuoH [Prevotellaceae bacterium]|jgi:NADH-quinone oxidoreductase subunit H|nr:NADH-quinone oxidoreductase subunit NuoH [Prevotellaceae bacterium]